MRLCRKFGGNACGFPWGRTKGLLAGLTALLLLGGLEARAQQGFDPGLAGIQVQCQGRTLQYNIESIFLLPGELVRLQVPASDQQPACEIRVSTGRVLQTASDEFKWHPPSRPGVYTAELAVPAGGQRLTLQAFVLVPFSRLKSKKMNGYRIGRYPQPASRGLVKYGTPRGWVEATPENLELAVSPHFKLGQFVCKQGGEFPKYLMLDERLLAKMEKLLAAVNDQGRACSTLAVLSGYRTPEYNRKLGNVAYSSHVWGWAADVYVDADRDGRMDDVNRDGRVNLLDAYWLFQLADSLDCEPETMDLTGGLGLYPATAIHGPFVHMDVRGRPARWGLQRLRPVWAEKP